MRFWKKIWKDELDAKIPALRQDIIDRPLPTADATDAETVSRGDVLVRSKKRALAVASAGIAVLILALAILCAVLLAPKKGYDAYAFTIEINPAITVATDKNGNVTGIAASNADADIILNGGAEENMVGKPFERAAEWYTDKAALLGFIDLNAVSGVRITACENGGKFLGSAQTALENYFADKGVFALVIAETADAKEFSARSGLDGIENVASAVSAVKDGETLFGGRGAEEKSKEELAAAYEEYVSNEAFASSLSEFLSGELGVITENARDIKELCELYAEIRDHEDNPSVLKSYWSVKKFYGDSLSGEFKELVEQMDAALARYEKKYGVKIENDFQLFDAAEKYVTLSVANIGAMLEDFTAETLKRNFTALSDILNLIGADGNPFVSLMTAPTDAREFREKISAALSVEYSERERKNAAEYGREREKISAEAYEDFKKNTLAQFGSEKDFWENHKKV